MLFESKTLILRDGTGITTSSTPNTERADSEVGNLGQGGTRGSTHTENFKSWRDGRSIQLGEVCDHID